jgi:hypothetical protein
MDNPKDKLEVRAISAQNFISVIAMMSNFLIEIKAHIGISFFQSFRNVELMYEIKISRRRRRLRNALPSL